MYSKKTHTVLVTGASGFIGKELVKALASCRHRVKACVRSESARRELESFKNDADFENISIYNIGNLDAQTKWQEALVGVDVVVHCAGRAHHQNENSIKSLAKYQQINFEATKNLAEQAYKCGVKRFIFLSSISVFGSSSCDHAFNEDSPLKPIAPYAKTKLYAETALLEMQNTMEKIIIRPPLVYGPNAKGNFERLVRILGKKIPLPLGGIKNKRQFIGIYNLIDFILNCIRAPKIGDEVFLVADRQVLSTTDFLKVLTLSMGQKSRLLSVPSPFLTLGLKLLGKSRMVEQLFSNIVIDITKAKNVLNWEPPYTTHEQLKRTFVITASTEKRL